jgi:hypothetical protein
MGGPTEPGATMPGTTKPETNTAGTTFFECNQAKNDQAWNEHWPRKGQKSSIVYIFIEMI